MDWLACVLCLLMGIYVVAYAVQNFRIIDRYKKAEGRVRCIEGSVIACKKAVKTKVGDEKVVVAYPIYECVIEGENKQLHSSIKYSGITVGQKVELAYDGETGEIWCQRDLPLMKKQVLWRMIWILIIIGIVIVESIVF